VYGPRVENINLQPCFFILFWVIIVITNLYFQYSYDLIFLSFIMNIINITAKLMVEFKTCKAACSWL